MGSLGSPSLSAVKPLLSPFLILIVPCSRPSLHNRTLPDPFISSYSQAPRQKKDTPVLVEYGSTCAMRQCIRSLSSSPVSEMYAGPSRSRPSLTQVSVFVMRHHPWYSSGITSSLMIPYRFLFFLFLVFCGGWSRITSTSATSTSLLSTKARIL